MTAPIAHFAINADDVEATRRFYETTFDWRFVAWGPPGFFRLDVAQLDQASGAASSSGASSILGALQQRRELAPGQRITGFECTVAVADVDETARRAVSAGGRLLMEKTTITGVGDLIWLEDPSGNVVGAMRYDSTAE